MTVKAFYNNKMIRVPSVQYILTFPNGTERRITRGSAATMIFDPELPYGFRVERRITLSWMIACPWCGARPELFELDCDGPAATGTCGSPQCNRLRRCEGCGKDDSVRYGSGRGRLCEGCDTTARRDNLEAARDRYALVPCTW